MDAMRVIFAGSPDVAVPSLHTLHDAGHEIVAVLTQPDARGKRGRELHPTPVKAAAEALGLHVLNPPRASAPEAVAQIRALDADAAAVVAYGQILRPELIAATRLGWVNLHFSVLPAWRGAAPVQRALMAGDDVTGASTFLIEQGLDTGPVIGHLTETIRPTDTAGTLLDRLAHAGAPLLAASIDALGAGHAAPQAQGEDGVSYAPKLTREDAYVKWEYPAHVVDRQIRGCTPAPGAWTTLPDGTAVKLGPVSPRPSHPPTVAGQILLRDGEVLVGTGSDPVALGWVQPAGRGQVDAVAWWRGARLHDGAQMGEA